MIKASRILAGTTIAAAIVASYLWQELRSERKLTAAAAESRQKRTQDTLAGTQFTPRRDAPGSLQETLARASQMPDDTEVQASANSKLVSDIASYVQYFRPGVYREEPMPEFASEFIFPSKEERELALEAIRKYEQEPIDNWAADMEQRVRSFFERQPEISRARVSVGCRKSRCQIQIVEMHSDVRLSTVFESRLSSEPWFKDKVLLLGSGGTTPDVGAAHYAKLVLVARPALRKQPGESLP